MRARRDNVSGCGALVQARPLCALSMHLLALEVMREAIVACDTSTNPNATTSIAAAAAETAALVADGPGEPSPTAGLHRFGSLSASDTVSGEEAPPSRTMLAELQRSFVASVSRYWTPRSRPKLNQISSSHCCLSR